MSELTQLKTQFDNLKSLRLNIKRLFENLKLLTDKLKMLYLSYIELAGKNNMFFGIDPLHFQRLLINLEYENMEKIYKLIDNKLYCDYYKLFKLICKYADETINDKKIKSLCNLKNKYPVYKDLDQYKVYEFELINDLHHDIIQLLDEMTSHLNQKELEFKSEEDKSNNGLNIDNYISTLMFDNAILREKIKLYKRYIDAFHKYHNTYLSRLHIKLGIMWGQINQDIRLSFYNSTNDAMRDDVKSVVSGMEMNSNVNSSPKITTVQQAELFKFIKESGQDNNSSNKELELIISHISSENDSVDEIRNEDNVKGVATPNLTNNEKLNNEQFNNDEFNNIIIDTLIDRDDEGENVVSSDAKLKKRLKKKRNEQNKKNRNKLTTQ